MIFHRSLKGSKNSSFLNEPGLARWTTCVRSLLLGHPRAESGQSYDRIISGAEATQFLTEIVSGLQSPMLGETEVHGQYKQFLAEVESQVSSELFTELMSVHFLARKVRSDFLKNLGCQSYGSFARKKMREIEGVTILGAGKLAAEILPWIVKKRDRVSLVSRNPDKISSAFQQHENLDIVNYEELPSSSQGLVITAPLSAAEIEKLFPEKEPQLTLDFRAESRHDALSSRFNPVSLDEVFGEIECQRNQVENQVQKARSFIAESSSQLESVVGRSLRSIRVS